MTAIVTTTDALRTESGLCIGWFVTEELDGEYVRGAFTPGPDFPAVEPLFREFEELVNDQVLSLTDQAMAEIDRLGITVVLPNGCAVPVQDVQVYSDGVASYRLRG